MIHADLVRAAELLAGGAFDERPGAEDAPELADRLYGWYLNASSLPAPTGPLLPHELGMAAVLRLAHHDATRFEGGWRAETVSTWGRVLAHKGEHSRVLDRSEYTVPARTGLRAQPGDALLVTHCWDWIDEETGFWHLRRGEWPPAGADRLVRLYWNCAPAHTARILEALSSIVATDPSLSYMIKTPALPGHTGRADAVVLYLGPDGFASLESSLRAAAAALGDVLREPTPRMTLRLAPGAALAQSHVDGASFGDSRCRLMAAAFETADPAVRRSASRVVGALADAFVAAGLDPARPYLERSA